jgi:hypothetical protein
MKDKRGGARPGAGRKSKAEELGLNDLMDSIGPTDKVLQAIYKLATGSKPNIEAQKIWLSYKYGKPKESVTITDNSIHWIEEEHGNTDTQTT